MKRLFLLTIFLAPILVAAQGQMKNKTMLFLSNQTDSIPYRIPAVAELPDGSLYALTDYRHCKTDIGYGRVDIRGKRFKGRKWGKEFVLIEGTGVEGAVDCGYGDPAIVADRESKEIIVVLMFRRHLKSAHLTYQLLL